MTKKAPSGGTGGESGSAEDLWGGGAPLQGPLPISNQGEEELGGVIGSAQDRGLAAVLEAEEGIE
eukprot:7527169-Prorocentrum_lima.AAC.1